MSLFNLDSEKPQPKTSKTPSQNLASKPSELEVKPSPVVERKDDYYTVWKYDIGMAVRGCPFTISLPVEIDILLLGRDKEGKLCIWVEVYAGNDYEDYTVCVVGTGDRIPNGMNHYASCIDGGNVWHLYIGE